MTMTVARPTTTWTREAEPEPLPDDAPVYRKRNLRTIRRSDWLSLLGAAVAALSATVLLFLAILPVRGLIPFVLICYLIFVVCYALLVSLEESAEVVKDRLAAVAVWTLGCLLFSVLGFVVVYVLARGRNSLGHVNFLTQDMTLAGPLQGLDIGGITHAMVGTLEQIAIALAITIPLGLTCAVFLNEFPGRFARFVRTIVEAMTALPSIVAGLFIYATLILGITVSAFGHVLVTLKIEKSGLAAALALSVMMLPIIIRAADVVIRLVPASLREASYALGTSRWSTVWHIVLPTARSGLTTAVILGTARGIGETSPVLLTAGATSTVNLDPTEGPQMSLPLAIFEFVKSPQQAFIERGFGTAAVLLSLVLILFIAARLIGGRGPGHESSRRRRRNRRLSAQDARRFAARAGAVAVALGLIGATVLRPVGPAAADGSYVPVSGAGSTWSQNALDQWKRNVSQYGMQVNYQGTGSSDGRNQFRNGTVDFAVSEIPYGLTDAGVVDLPPERGFAYMPIVAGGTALMYNLRINGQRVTNLRLSGETVAQIFTGNIRMWNDPAIKVDNPGLALPARQIIPVVRSDGSGTTAQFTTWLSKKFGSLWNNYCSTAGRSTPCGVTSFFPVVSGSGFVAQAGSLGVSGFVAQEQNEGTITYVEYSYALNSNFPVVKLLNASGYYVEPTPENVAVALLKAKINQDSSSSQFLTQILDGVYANADRRAYPLSSYSYMILPTRIEGSFNESKGYTLGDFAYYFLCEGQQQAPVLGYSPLPINLVKAGLSQVKRIPGVDVQSIDIKDCHNPTFSSSGVNTLAANAPYPQPCDKKGPVQCTTRTGGSDTDTPVTQPPTGTPTASPTSGSPSQQPGATATTDPGVVPIAPGPGGTPIVDPDTGVVITPGALSGGEAPLVSGQAVSLAANSSERVEGLLMALAALVLALAVVLPPLIGRRTTRRPR